MKSTTTWSMMCVICLASNLLGAPATQPAKEEAAKRNAALLYWQAFAMLPELSMAEEEVVSNFQSGQLDDTVAGIIKKAEPSLKLLRRGAQCRRCDWGIDKADGWEAILPHLSKARTLVRLAILRARYNFSRDKPQEAVEDLAAALTLGRHIGQDGPLMAMSVQLVFESVVVGQVAQHVMGLSPETLKLLDDRLAAMPPAADMASLLRAETDSFTESYENYPRRFYKQAITDYRELAKIAHLPPDEFEKKAKALRGSTAKTLVPSIVRTHLIYAAVRSKTAMLNGVIAALRAGDVDKLKSIKDPYGDGPFVYKKTKKGFELHGKVRIKDKAISLEFPAPKAPHGRKASGIKEPAAGS